MIVIKVTYRLTTSSTIAYYRADTLQHARMLIAKLSLLSGVCAELL